MRSNSAGTRTGGGGWKAAAARLVKEGLPLWEIDSDRHPDLSARFDVQVVPTFVLVKEGKEISRAVGGQGEDDLRAMLKQLPRQVEVPLPADLEEADFAGRSPRPHRSLTARERQILSLIATGASNKAIARRLEVSGNTVKFHLAAIFAKLGVHSRLEAVAYATRNRLF